MPIQRILIVLILFLSAAAAGCSGPHHESTSDGDTGSAPNSVGAATSQDATAEPGQEEGTGGEPTPEGQGPEKPAGKADHPYAKLAAAPVGSNDNSTGPVNERFCVGVSLLRDPPAGLTVKVTGISLNRSDMRLRSGTCQGRRSCPGYTFSSENAKCSVVVVPTRADPDGGLPETRLTLSGKVYCAAGSDGACAEWVRDAASRDDKFIKLFLPSEPAPEQSTPESDHGTPTTSASTNG